MSNIGSHSGYDWLQMQEHPAQYMRDVDDLGIVLVVEDEGDGTFRWTAWVDKYDAETPVNSKTDYCLAADEAMAAAERYAHAMACDALERMEAGLEILRRQGHLDDMLVRVADTMVRRLSHGMGDRLTGTHDRVRMLAKELKESAAAKREHGRGDEAVRESNLARICEAFAADRKSNDEPPSPRLRSVH